MEIHMEKNRKTVTQIAYYSFYLGVIIEVLLVLIDKSAYTNPVEGRLFQLTFLLFGLKVLFTKYSSKEWLIIFLFALLGAVSYFSTGRNEIIRIVVFLAACKEIDMKRCLKLVFFLTLAGCVIIVILSLAGLYGTISLTQDYGRGSVETRYTLGMGHPNALQCMIWALTTLGLYLYAERMRWYAYAAILMLNIGFFMLTDSKTGLLMSIFTILFSGIMGRVKGDFWKKVCCIGGICISVGSVILSVIIAANAYRIYNYVWHYEWTKPTQFFVYLDRALTGRIHSLVGTIRFEGTIQTWKLFSEPANNYYFDMGWIRLFYWYGIIPACIFIMVMLAVMIYCCKQKKYIALAMVVSFAAYTFVEAHAVSIYIARNYVLFLVGAYWYKILDWKKSKLISKQEK